MIDLKTASFEERLCLISLNFDLPLSILCYKQTYGESSPYPDVHFIAFSQFFCKQRSLLITQFILFGRSGYCTHLIRKNSAVISWLLAAGGWAGSLPVIPRWLPAAAEVVLWLHKNLLLLFHTTTAKSDGGSPQLNLFRVQCMRGKSFSWLCNLCCCCWSCPGVRAAQPFCLQRLLCVKGAWRRCCRLLLLAPLVLISLTTFEFLYLCVLILEVCSGLFLPVLLQTSQCGFVPPV